MNVFFFILRRITRKWNLTYISMNSKSLLFSVKIIYSRKDMDLYFRLTGRCLSVLPRSFVELRGQTWLDSFNVDTRRWIQSFSFTLYRKQVVLNLYFLEDLLVSNFRLPTLAFIRLIFTQNISLDQCSHGLLFYRHPEYFLVYFVCLMFLIYFFKWLLRGGVSQAYKIKPVLFLFVFVFWRQQKLYWKQTRNVFIHIFLHTFSEPYANNF